ncbi:hypothetical protein ACM66B_002983 [Microbotryomycetes sp. NB124-2]
MPRELTGTPRGNLWSQGTYNGGSAFKETQTRLADKRPLVTPRTKDAPGSAKQAQTLQSVPKQSTLEACFTAASQHKRMQPKDMTPQRAPSSKQRNSSSSDEPVPGPSPLRAETRNATPQLHRGHCILGMNTPAPTRTPSIGHRVLQASTTGNHKRGATLAFDGPDLPLDDRELEEDSQRRAAGRIIEGAPGQIDLLPAEDFEGFGSSVAPKRPRKALELSSLPLVASPDKSYQEIRPAYKATSRSSSNHSNESRRQESMPGEDSASEPTTIDDSGRDSDGRSSQPSRADLEDVQQMLRPRQQASKQASKQASNVLIANSSDNEDENGDVDQTARKNNLFGGLNMHFDPAADDSGFVDGLLDLDDESGDVFLVPATPAKKVAAMHYPKPSPPQYDSQHDSSSDAEQDAHDVFNFLVPNTQSIATRAPNVAHGSEVVCDGTQTMAQFRNASNVTSNIACRGTPSPIKSPRAPLVKTTSPRSRIKHSDQAWQSLESAWQGQKPTSPPPPPLPRQSRLNEYFVGATNSQQQGTDEGDDDWAQIADSQDCGDGMTLEQAVAFKEALDHTKRMGSHRAGRELSTIQERPDDIREGDDDDAQEDHRANAQDGEDAGVDAQDGEDAGVEGAQDLVETSDPEDGPFSPLTSPVKPRVGHFSRLDSFSQSDWQVAAQDGAQDPATAFEKSVSHSRNPFLPPPPSNQASQAASTDEPDTEDTAMESYWTLEFDSLPRLDDLELPSASFDSD